jgi:hypothetical protein
MRTFNHRTEPKSGTCVAVVVADMEEVADAEGVAVHDDVVDAVLDGVPVMDPVSDGVGVVEAVIELLGVGDDVIVLLGVGDGVTISSADAGPTQKLSNLGPTCSITS